MPSILKTTQRLSVALLTLWLLQPDLRCEDQFPESPSPVDNAKTVGPCPVLSWIFGTESALPNGGFEEGIQGWTSFWPGTNQVTIAPYEGTNAFKSAHGRLSREISVPPAPCGLTFATTRNKMSVEIRSLAADILGEVVPTSNGYFETGWRRQIVDLSAYGGQTVRLIWYFNNAEIVTLLDDMRIFAGSPNTAFDIYFGRPNQPLNKLGRTLYCSWPMEGLTGPYDWQVEAITLTTTNRSPVWRFTTGVGDVSAGPYHMQFTRMPEAICPAQPTPIKLEMKDYQGFPAVPREFSPRLTATGTNAPPPPILITEVEWVLGSGLEFVNPTTNEVNVGNWIVQIFSAFDATTPYDLSSSQTITLPSNATLAPGALFTIVRGRPPNNPWPSLTLPGVVQWTGAQRLIRGGVVVRDSSSNVVDAVFAEEAVAGQLQIFQRETVSTFDWGSDPLNYSFNKSLDSFQRVGNSDQNVASDWVRQPPSLGENNIGLVLPFRPGYGALPLETHALATNRAKGSWTGTASVLLPSSNVTFHAEVWNQDQKFRLAAHSQNVDVLGPQACDMPLPSPATSLTRILLLYELSTETEIEIETQTTPRIFYSVEHSFDLESPWTPVVPPFLAKGQSAAFQFPVWGTNDFFRVRAEH
jgi:hypothetical protein